MSDARRSLESWCKFLYYCLYSEVPDALWVVPSSSSEGGFRFRLQADDACADGFFTRECALSVEPGYLRHLYERMVAVSTLLGARRVHLTPVDSRGASVLYGAQGVIVARGVSGTLALAADMHLASLAPLASPPVWSSLEVSLPLGAPARAGLVVALPEEGAGGVRGELRGFAGAPLSVELEASGGLLYARLAPSSGAALGSAAHVECGARALFSGRLVALRWLRSGDEAWPVLVLAPESAPRLGGSGVASLGEERCGRWVSCG